MSTTTNGISDETAIAGLQSDEETPSSLDDLLAEASVSPGSGGPQTVSDEVGTEPLSIDELLELAQPTVEQYNPEQVLAELKENLSDPDTIEKDALSTIEKARGYTESEAFKLETAMRQSGSKEAQESWEEALRRKGIDIGNPRYIDREERREIERLRVDTVFPEMYDDRIRRYRADTLAESILIHSYGDVVVKMASTVEQINFLTSADASQTDINWPKISSVWPYNRTGIMHGDRELTNADIFDGHPELLADYLVAIRASQGLVLKRIAELATAEGVMVSIPLALSSGVDINQSVEVRKLLQHEIDTAKASKDKPQLDKIVRLITLAKGYASGTTRIVFPNSLKTDFHSTYDTLTGISFTKGENGIDVQTTPGKTRIDLKYKDPNHDIDLAIALFDTGETEP